MKKIIRVICFVIAMLLVAGPVLDVDVHAAGFTISGTVTTSGSASETIKVELLSGGSVVSQVSAAAKKVQYSFTKLAPGTYTLRVSKVGHETYIGTVTISNANVVKDVTLTLTATPTYSVSGAIASGGSASAAVVVSLYKGSILVKSVTLTGNSVNYSLDGIAPGQYTLKVTKQDHIPHQSTVTVVDANVVKNVALGQENYTVSGHVTSYGSSEDPVTVKLLSGATVMESVVLNGNYAGFTFTGIAPGKYTLEVTKIGHSVSSTAITVSSANVTKNITLTQISSATYTISGTISCHGNPNEPIYLKLYSGTTLLKSLTLTGNTAKYSLSGLPSGTYHLSVKKAGFDDYEAQVDINGANTTKNVPMFKINGGVTFGGKVSGISGTAAVSIKLYEQGKTEPAYETSRNGNGSFTIADVNPGTYVIKATASGYGEYTATVLISGETTHNITMKAASHTCTGGKATCQSKAQCSVCNAFYGDFAAHAWTNTWDHSTAAGHGHFCSTPGCKEVSPMVAHTPNIPAPTEDDDQVCTACGYVMAKAEGPAAPPAPPPSTDPSDPTDPTEPDGPGEPTDPTQPGDTTDPTEPDDPVDPTDPTEPADPADPSDPADPPAPADPIVPTEPADPTQPTKPSSGGSDQAEGMSWWWIALIAVAAAALGVGITLMIVKKKK